MTKTARKLTGSNLDSGLQLRGLSSTFTKLVTFALSLVTVSVAFASPAPRYLVEFTDARTFSQVASQLHLQSQPDLGAVVLPTASGSWKYFSTGGRVQVTATLEHLKSVIVTSDDSALASRLAASGFVASVEKEVFRPSPKPIHGFQLTSPFQVALPAGSDSDIPTTGPRTPWGIKAVNAPEAWANSKMGEGVLVAVLDTGIDRDHPALKGQIEDIKSFIPGESTGPYPGADQEGHGTHVAGTIAGAALSGGFVGVAPRARILTGQVCGEDGCSNISVAAGINWAINRKAHVISMSLGGPVGTPAEKRAVALAISRGISVIAASGNDGTNKVSFPAAFPSVVAVGAVDSKLGKAKFSQWGPELWIMAPGVDVISSVPMGSGREARVRLMSGGEPQVLAASAFTGAPEVRSELVNEVVPAGIGKAEDFNGVSVAGKFALISRGQIPFAEKVKNALANNAAGVVFYNNEPGLVQGAATADGSPVAVPVFMIEQEVGKTLVQQIQAGKTLKVGVQTVATDFAAFAGTSMATPHVAGVVALIRAANPKLSPIDVRNILKQTATPLSPNGENETGNGMINAAAAVNAAIKR